MHLNTTAAVMLDGLLVVAGDADLTGDLQARLRALTAGGGFPPGSGSRCSGRSETGIDDDFIGPLGGPHCCGDVFGLACLVVPEPAFGVNALRLAEIARLLQR
ncbi:hypothetical protein [Amycolatopsis sp. NPDC004079]|uniref:hypothetical protein n=1 Tax=Amycolatopsis sp. NPDC004079 TaxID=3154549 RepID=UPI00339E79A8